MRRSEEVRQALETNGAGALEAMKGFRFDTVMFPINFVEFFKMGFGKPVLELADKQGTAVPAIKPLSTGTWPEGVERTRKWWYRTTETQEEVDLAMRFTLSKKPAAAAQYTCRFILKAHTSALRVPMYDFFIDSACFHCFIS